MRTTLVLADVAGTADAPVFIGAWQDEKPVFSGAVSLRARVEGAADARLPTEEARRNVRVYVFEDCGGGEIAECGQAAIRFDGNISGMTVYGNVIRRSGTCYFGAININGGRNNVIDSNRFEDCPLAVSTFFYPPWHWREIFEGTDKNARYVRDQTEGRINVRQPPYSTAYPSLAQIRHLPQFNFITRNRAVNGVVDPGCPAPTALYGNSSSDGAPAP